MSQANTTPSNQLIFVYNTKSGFMHSAMDLIHKSASPKTYPCKLCIVTFSGATMNKLWKQYIAGLGIPAIFMHRNEFMQAYPDYKIAFPVILLESNGSFATLISSNDFKNIADLSGLMNLLNKKLRSTTSIK